MDTLVNHLAELVERGSGPSRPESPRPIDADLVGAPESVTRLATAMANHDYKVELGGFLMRHNFGHFARQVPTMEAEIDAARDGDFDDFDAALADTGIVPSKTLLLCHDGGGMSALGLSWANALECIVIELEEPGEGNFVTHLRTPADVIGYLSERQSEFDAPDLDVLREKLG